MSSRYDAVYKRSIEDPEGFWAEAAEAVHWYEKWDKVFDDSRKPFCRWFAGGVRRSSSAHRRGRTRRARDTQARPAPAGSTATAA